MSPVDERIGRRVRGKRRALGLSLATLARAIGVEPETMEAYERATMRVTPEHLLKLAEHFGVTISYFMS
jgi:transcriptional regulator with XRE-family HTH domain